MGKRKSIKGTFTYKGHTMEIPGTGKVTKTDIKKAVKFRRMVDKLLKE